MAERLLRFVPELFLGVAAGLVGARGDNVGDVDRRHYIGCYFCFQSGEKGVNVNGHGGFPAGVRLALVLPVVTVQRRVLTGKGSYPFTCILSLLPF